MPQFTPPSLFFNYYPNSGVVPNSDLLLEGFPSTTIPESIQVHSQPDWMNTILQEVIMNEENTDQIESASFIAAVVSNSANNLPIGIHEGVIKIEYKFGQLFPFTAYVDLQVIIRVFEYQQLNVTPSSFSYNLNVGDANPPASYFVINTNNNWSISPSETWLSFSQTNGTGQTQVSLFVDISGLAAGSHTANFLVNDGDSTKLCTVYVILQGDSNTDNLTVTPNILSFSEVEATAPQDEKVLNIDTTEPANLSASVGWLSFLPTTTPTGYSTVAVSTVNTQILSEGTYPATITVQTASYTKIVNVVLFVTKKQNGNLISKGFYFSGDRNKLILTNPTPNAVANLNIQANGPLGYKIYNRRISYFQNLIDVIIGRETEKLLRPEPIPEILATQLFIPVKPVRYDITVDSSISAGASNSLSTNTLKNFEGLLFINGRKPDPLGPTLGGTASELKYKLCQIPESITIPKDGCIVLSVRDKSPTSVKQVTTPTQTHYVNFQSGLSNAAPEVFSMIVNVGDYTLSEGQEISLTFGFLKVKARIKNTVHPTTRIIWQNEWDCPEVFCCTGPVTIEEEGDERKVTLAKEGKEYVKITNIKEPQAFEVNTGNLYGEDELKWLSSLVRAKRIWLEIGKQRYEVTRNFRGLPSKLTRAFTNGIDLKFDSAEK
ncbi:hypothetical protein MG296_10475 [Flavobacteriaceae bacterium TK19130]|nr:hypothetical protein [Thermobacterium salinum]